MPPRSRSRRPSAFGRQRSYGWVIVPLALAAVIVAHFLAPGGTHTRQERASPTAQSGETSLAGAARITDGDTIRVGATRIRFYGIDAPEKAQSCYDTAGRPWACGIAARQALSARIAGQPVQCQKRDTDRYGRTVAVCRAGGADLNDWMVRQGWAVAYRQYGTDYAPAEEEAHSQHRGIWAGHFDLPSDWRRHHRG